ncbi:DUF2075 domain-containing protein [Carboxylicivirga marina]|uniref:DUF2075 domain-containing protein n=1 Tax=Carboxylicivirga marina TaxID=2800988 RepID=UPI0025978C03|nr:DUF2075 domain-containing protein [uncultured Carboxylicivirga sp.]
MNRAYYSNEIENFLNSSTNEILGILADKNEFATEQTQKDAWKYQIEFLQDVLKNYTGSIYFEYGIPRMGKRIDVLLLIKSILFVVEFKVGDKEYASPAIDQVWDYALDLKNFHETSHDKTIIPILIATKAKDTFTSISSSKQKDNLYDPVKTNSKGLSEIISHALLYLDGQDLINKQEWENGRYQPTPTIIEAATALYNNHTVKDISRSDASAINLSKTTDEVAKIIQQSKDRSEKSICFVTGVPGAGKTLVGLNIATTHFDKDSDLYSVFLSGNGPLVKILQEALARDKVKRAKANGEKLTKKVARSEVQAFIQNVHHFRDEGLRDSAPPIEHVTLFDEAQRAWTKEQTTSFMKQKKGVPDFNKSEPEFLISCLDRHPDWAVVVCLVGGGQEINTGEAGISEWISALERSFPDWKIYMSTKLTDSEYNTESILKKIHTRNNIFHSNALHLSVSMRSFRAENVSLLVKKILDIEKVDARDTLTELKHKYPIVLTRDFSKAKKWLKNKARGTERYGIVVSSQAQRLKPYAIDVKSPIDPVNWFLNGKDDIRSSYYLEDVATEFHVQGLELDWACVAWDGDFRYSNGEWIYKSFKGNKWQNIKKEDRKLYLKNAYRVLLTRARQSMVIVVPHGDKDDPTRLPEFYNDTFEYLKSIGFAIF